MPLLLMRIALADGRCASLRPVFFGFLFARYGLRLRAAIAKGAEARVEWSRAGSALNAMASKA